MDLIKDTNSLAPLITVAILTAIFTLIVNILYFEYKIKKENSKYLLKQILTKLLLPLYIILHVRELSTKAWLETDNASSYEEAHSDLPTRTLSSVEKIIEENLYLANDNLHEACLNFLEWAYRSDSNQRFQNLMNRNFNFTLEDKGFKEFYEIVIFEYDKCKKEYLGNGFLKYLRQKIYGIKK